MQKQWFSTEKSVFAFSDSILKVEFTHKHVDNNNIFAYYYMKTNVFRAVKPFKAFENK